MQRREFLKGVMAWPLIQQKWPTLGLNNAPIRVITSGPSYHWFGYYDKLQFDPTGRFVLGMRVEFDGRSPQPDDVIEIGIIDLQKNDTNGIAQWQKVGESRAWSWQQGCMLQWVPKSNRHILWNDRATEGRYKNQFVCHILDVKTGQKHTLPRAIYALSPNGRWAVGTEFSRIQDLRPGYGYAGLSDPYYDEKKPSAIGIYRMNLKNGHSHLLMSLEEAAQIPHRGESMADNFHWFNHLLVNPTGTRITFLHRWRQQREERQKMAVGGFSTRMFTLNANGSQPFIIDASGHTSHFIWRDTTHICAYTRPEGYPWGFYVLEDHTGKIAPIQTNKMPVNGHQTYVPGRNNEWLLNDNYANPQNRNQTPYLYHIPTDRRIDLGHFPAAENAVGEWRCDLHPRCSPDGNYVCIDSTHGGNGRQMYLIDIRPYFQN
ncbi:MAG: hypothetical protein ACK4GN_09985 [Runella sp.]